MERIDRGNAGRRPDAVDPGVGEQALAEEGPEEGDKEHHFRGDEQRHAIAQAELYHRAVGLLDHRLVNDLLPPGEHGAEYAEEAEDEQPREMGMHQQNRADHHSPGRGCAHQGQRVRLQKVIGLLRPAFQLHLSQGFRHVRLKRILEKKTWRRHYSTRGLAASAAGTEAVSAGVFAAGARFSALIAWSKAWLLAL